MPASFQPNDFMRRVRRLAGTTALARQCPPSLGEALSLSGPDFVQALFRILLKRPADHCALSTYSTHANSSVGKARVLASILKSSEFRSGLLARTATAVREGLTPLRLGLIHFGRATLGRVLEMVAGSRKREERTSWELFYQHFEDKYRGPFDEVADTLSERYLEAARRALAVGTVAVDLGCGRGEWLSILQGAGFQARGVDTSRQAVEQCQSLNLNSIRADAYQYLCTQPTASVALISAFHVIEHLTPLQLWGLLRQARRVLAPGGVLILETPNARNLLVSAGDFYRDPTHNNPIFPDTLDFMLQELGFEGDAYFLTKDGLKLARATDFHNLQCYIDVSRDLAWIGQTAGLSA